MRGASEGKFDMTMGLRNSEEQARKVSIPLTMASGPTTARTL